jgi:hypothetical protein
MHQIDVDEPVVGAAIEVIGAKESVGRVVMMEREQSSDGG